MTQPIISSRGVAQDLFVHALRSAYIAGYRVLDPDYASNREPDIYEKVRRDPVIAQAMDTRLRGVASRHYTISPFSDDPTDKLVAKMTEQAFKYIRRFTESRYELAQAVVRGMSVGYIEGERRLLSLAGTPAREWWVPTRIKDVDRRRFRLMANWENRQAPDAKLTAGWEIFSVSRGKWEALKNPEYFIRVVYNDEEARLGYGRGLLEAMYFYHWIKGEVLKEGLHGIKKWARGKTIAKIDGLRAASAGADNRDNDNVKNAFLLALQRMEEEQILVIDKQDDVENIESTGQGHQMVMELIRYLDGALITLICGSQLPFGGGEDVGSNGRAETELEVHESLINFDREKIDEDLTYDLVGLFCRMNRGNFAELGLGAGQMPRFETIQEKREDPEKNARVLNDTLNAGLDIRKDEAYQRTGWTPPQEGDDVIKGRAQSTNPFGSPFDGGEFDRAMPDEKSAKLARVLMKAGIGPDAAVKCAVEAGKASEPLQAAPPPQPLPPANITLNNPVTIHPAAQASAPAAGPVTVVSPIHIPEKILIEAMRPADIIVPAPIVNVPAPVVHVAAPTVNVQPPNVDVKVAAPSVTVEAPNVTVNPVVEVKLPDMPFTLHLPPVKKSVEFTKDKNGALTGAEITSK